MLDESNTHAKYFRMAQHRLKQQHVQELKLQLISDRHKDDRIYNTPTVSKVVVIMPGDVDTTFNRYILLETQSGKL